MYQFARGRKCKEEKGEAETEAFSFFEGLDIFSRSDGVLRCKRLRRRRSIIYLASGDVTLARIIRSVWMQDESGAIVCEWADARKRVARWPEMCYFRGRSRSIFFCSPYNMQFAMQASSPIFTGLMSQQTLGEWECRDVRGDIRGHNRGFFHLRTPPYLLKKKPCLCTCNISTYPKSPHTGFGHRITECFSHSVDCH